MKISHRLIAGNIVVILLVITVGAGGLFLSENIVRSFENKEVHFRSIITAATEAASYAKRAEGHLMLYLSLHDDRDREKFFERYASLVEEVKILDHAVDIPSARELVEKITKDVALDKRFVYYLLAATGICIVPLTGFSCDLKGFRITLLESAEKKFDDIFRTVKEKIVEYLKSA